MGFLNKLFGKEKKQENKTVEFWQLLPFNIFDIPNDKYAIEEKGTVNVMDGSSANSYTGKKAEKSTHPWIYDEIKIHYSDSTKVGKTINLNKNLQGFNSERIVDYVNWLSSIFKVDDLGMKVMDKNEKYELEDSLFNPDGAWMGRSWMDSGEWNPKCSIMLGENGDVLTTTFWFSPEEA